MKLEVKNIDEFEFIIGSFGIFTYNIKIYSYTIQLSLMNIIIFHLVNNIINLHSSYGLTVPLNAIKQ